LVKLLQRQKSGPVQLAALYSSQAIVERRVEKMMQVGLISKGLYNNLECFARTVKGEKLFKFFLTLKRIFRHKVTQYVE
jgi:hypothetical protein